MSWATPEIDPESLLFYRALPKDDPRAQIREVFYWVRRADSQLRKATDQERTEGQGQFWYNQNEECPQNLVELERMNTYHSYFWYGWLEIKPEEVAAQIPLALQGKVVAYEFVTGTGQVVCHRPFSEMWDTCRGYDSQCRHRVTMILYGLAR